MKKLLAIALGMFAVSAMADIALDGPTFITSNTTVSEKVTGNGYYVVQNGATLTLSGEGNDFTGGIIISNGVAQADASGAFGTGDILLDYGADKNAAYAQVLFNAAGGTFPNDIIKKGKSYDEQRPLICALKDATLTGDITQDCEDMTYNDWLILAVGASNNKAASFNYDAVMTIEGSVSVGVGRMATYGWSPNYAARGKFVFKGSVSGSVLQTGWGSAHLGKVELWSTENQIESLNLKNFEVYLKAANVLQGSVVQGLINGWDGVYMRATVNMGGYDQTIRYLDRNDNATANQDGRNYNGGNYVAFVNTTAKPATLTVVGKDGASYTPTTDMVLLGNIKLVIDKADGSTGLSQQFKRRWSTTRAPVEIVDGTMRMRDEAKFLNVSNITVGVSGVLECENTEDTFPSLTNLTVNGLCRIQSGTDRCLPETAILRIGENGRFSVMKEKTVTVKKLYVNGKYMPAGTYTKDTAPWMVDPGTYSHQYTGSLVVTKGVSGLVFTVR